MAFSVLPSSLQSTIYSCPRRPVNVGSDNSKNNDASLQHITNRETMQNQLTGKGTSVYYISDNQFTLSSLVMHRLSDWLSVSGQ